MTRFICAVIMVIWLVWITPASACGASPPLFDPPPETLLSALQNNAAPYINTLDDYSTAMEKCYDGPMGPLELAGIRKSADALVAKIHALRELVQDRVRNDDLAYEDLLSSDHWGNIEALRVASFYAAAWAELSIAVHHISADDRRKSLRLALASLQQLTFEFRHPVLVQRAMYGLAVAQVENGAMAPANDTLGRLLSSLKRDGAPLLRHAVEVFIEEINAPEFRPPLPPIDQAVAKSRPQVTATTSTSAMEAALQALREARSADEIAALLQPAFQGPPEIVARAFDLIHREALLVTAMDYTPGPGLRQMSNGFERQQYTVVREGWRSVKPFYPHMPVAMKRQIDYQMGVAWLNLGELVSAETHLTVARNGLSESVQSTRLDQLIVLTRLSSETDPDDALLALAAQYQDIPSISVEHPFGVAHMMALRARVLLARHAASLKQWKQADRLLADFAPDMPAYQLFLGMRVRLWARALRGQAQTSTLANKLNKQARSGFALYNLWKISECPPGCLSGEPVRVHRAALDLAMLGGLSSPKFGRSWVAFETAGGDTRPLVPLALGYLLAQFDAERLAALLEPNQEVRAVHTLGHWKKLLTRLLKSGDIKNYYEFLSLDLSDLRGRPRAVALEALIAHDLAQGRPGAGLQLADLLIKDFPRRPAGWFLRAAVLQELGRGLEAARVLSSLARRTPPDDPVGMGARLGLAAVFVTLEKQSKACVMRRKIFSRPQADQNWQSAVQAFPVLQQWAGDVAAACKASQWQTS